jgi:ferrochelatase
MSKKIAVLLMNLGGPDSLEAVRPFLYNLFSDPAILRYPSPFRQILAWLISKLRYKKARQIYAKIGGKSPILENTQAQVRTLKQTLIQMLPDKTLDVFIAMRYFHPLTEKAVFDVQNFQPDHVILLPMYPQFSTTTTASSLKRWRDLFKEKVMMTEICCYPTNPGFIAAYVDLIHQSLKEIPENCGVRLLFSAHGLPQKIVDEGDPYAIQVSQSVMAIMGDPTLKNIDYQICYQSRVGPLKWLTPSLDSAMQKASTDQKAVIVVPISFVCEHSETLVELDMDFRKVAKSLNLPYYGRVPTVSCHPKFIDGLAHLVKERLQTIGQDIPKMCPANAVQCWCQTAHD